MVPSSAPLSGRRRSVPQDRPGDRESGARADQQDAISALHPAVLDHLVDDPLVEARGVQVGRLLGLQQLGHDGLGGHHIAQAQARGQHLGKGPQVDAALGVACRQRPGRRLVEPQVAVGVVLDDGQAQGLRPLDQGLAPCARVLDALGERLAELDRLQARLAKLRMQRKPDDARLDAEARAAEARAELNSQFEGNALLVSGASSV